VTIDDLLKLLSLVPVIAGVLGAFALVRYARWRMDETRFTELKRNADYWQELYKDSQTLLPALRDRLLRAEQRVSDYQDIATQMITEQRYCRRLAKALRDNEIPIPPRESE
jgi:hypothetical protein